MWHIYRNPSNKKLFEVAFVSKGKYIVGTRQGYAKKASACRAIVSAVNPTGSILVQDDTGDRPVLKYIHHDGSLSLSVSTKAGKKYIPNK